MRLCWRGLAASELAGQEAAGVVARVVDFGLLLESSRGSSVLRLKGFFKAAERLRFGIELAEPPSSLALRKRVRAVGVVFLLLSLATTFGEFARAHRMAVLTLLLEHSPQSEARPRVAWKIESA